MSGNSELEDFTLSFSLDDDFDDYDESFEDDFDDYEEDSSLDDFDDDVDLYDDVFKEEDIDEPYDDVEPEDGYSSYNSNDDDDDITFLDDYENQ